MNFYIASRIILSIDIILWFFCSLHGYSVIRSLGPKLLMIKKMLNELAIFLLIVVVFIFAYGVSTQALMYHNQELNLSLLKSVFLPAYFVIGGEYFEREKLMDMDECQSNLTEILITDTYTQEDCPEKYGANVSLFLLVAYIILLNILLVNLLIAIFSNTYQNVESEADEIWKFQRCKLVDEYFHRPLLPIPFTAFNYLLNIFKFIIRLFNCYKFKEEISLKSNFLDLSEKKRLKLWESFIAEEYVDNNGIEMTSKNQQNKDIYKKFDYLISRIDKITEIQVKYENSIKILQNKFDSLSGKNLNKSFDEIEDYTKISKNVLNSRPENTRIVYYPESNVEKKIVPNDKIKWSVPYPEYHPNEYTSENVLYNLSADMELLNKPDTFKKHFKFNSFDDISGLDRKSCLGEYSVQGGFPLNPKGRQGIAGRGSLNFWGPNIFYQIIFTRFKKDVFGNYINDSEGKTILEFLAIAKLNSKWRFPSIIQEKNFTIDELVEQKIGEIFLIENVDIEKLRSMLKNSMNIKKYYKDSNYNTDNAWLEFTVINIHDQEDTILSSLKLQDVYDGKRLEWTEVNDFTITNLSEQDSEQIKLLGVLHGLINRF